MAIMRQNTSGEYYISEDGKETSTSSSRRINKKLDLLNQKLDGLYKDIYVSRTDDTKNLDNILGRLDDALDNLQDNELNVSGMSELLRRIDNTGNTTSENLMMSVQELFNDQNLVNSLFQNQDIHRYISSQNYQYDMICRYLPKLLDALEIKRDNVLCSDNFSKDFINVKSNKSSKKATEIFSSNCSKMEDNYDLSDFFDKTYMNVSKYGEEFIYVVPYTLALQRLLKRQNIRKNSARLGQVSFYESTSCTSRQEVEKCVNEGYTSTKEFKALTESIANKKDFDEKFKGFEVNLHFNDTNIVNECVNEYVVLESKQDIDKFKSLSSIFEQSAINEQSEGNLKKQYEKINKQNDKLSVAASADGLIIPDNLNKDPNKIDKNINGAVLERLPRENIVPIYIGKVCMGYYYFEFREDPSACGYCGGHHMTPGIGNASAYSMEMAEDQQELAIRFISNKISQSIDTRFINANKDLKEEIYSILRYNDKFDIGRSNDIGVTFLPAEDVIHCYTNFDEYTHRGISDLQKSIVPSMLYILLYLTDIIGKITRSTDKRIYYVKQNVETNVARTMMNVVQQIKKGNMGMRQIESMNNILNIVGKYNDYIIPLGQSGDAPIQFEVMNGQDIQTPTDIMEKMEEAAVNGTGVPYEMLNSIYQQDFAVRFTMSNTRFLKTIYTLQRKTQRWMSKIYTKIYNYEYNENNHKIDIFLPPPVYLTMQNNQQIMDNITQQADKIIEVDLADESDEVKTEFKKIYTRNNLASYIDFAQVERYLGMARVSVESKKKPSTEDGADSDMMNDEEF